MNLRALESRLTGEDGGGLSVLEHSAPSGRRAIVEVAYVLGVLLAPDLAAAWTASHPGSRVLLIAGPVFALLGLVVARPWQSGRRAIFRVLLGFSVVALVTLAFANRPGEFVERKPRIGIDLENAGREPSDPPDSPLHTARVTSVRAGSAAAGHLRVGDRIVSIDGRPLADSDPSHDVVRRAHDPSDLQGPATAFSILRDHRSLTLRFPLGAAPKSSGGRSFFFQLSVRDLCLLALALCIVLSDGQTPRQLGLELRGASRELAHGGVALIGTYAVHLAAAVPLAAIAFGVGSIHADTQQKSAFLGELAGWAGEVRPWEIPIYMGLAGAFEEVVFRGFLITRLRQVFGAWSGALVVAAILFGLGHLAQGVLGAMQTAVLGLWFGWVFLRRRRLESVIVAHAAFNTIMFAAMIFVLQSGLWDRVLRALGR